MESFADDSVTDICCKCSAQSGKTEMMFALLCWVIGENPGPVLWVAADEKEATKLMNTRLRETLDSCEPVKAKMPANRLRKTTKQILFYGAPLIVAGAKSPQALQSTPFKFLILDEVRSYPKGALEMVFKRTRSFSNYGFKRSIISTPGEEGDGVELAYNAGDQRVWVTKCDRCGDEHPLEWGDKNSIGGLKWDATEDTKPEGRWNYRKVLKTVRYECWNPECNRVWWDNARDRRLLRTSGKWEAQNPLADETNRSFHWNALLPSWTNWSDQVKEFLLADEALDQGDPVKMRDHITETRGLHWTEDWILAKQRRNIRSVIADYNPRGSWKEEMMRFMTVDVQEAGGRYFVYVIRAWGYSGWARLLAYGRCDTLEQLEAIALDYEVGPREMVFDSGGEAATEVYSWVINSDFRWKAFKGEDADYFTVDGTRYLYKQSSVSPAVGRRKMTKAQAAKVRLYLYAKYGCLDRLDAFAKGRTGQWRVYDGDHDEYFRQVLAYVRKPVGAGGVRKVRWGKRTEKARDHYASCEIMQIAAADFCRLLDPEPVGDEDGA